MRIRIEENDFLLSEITAAPVSCGFSIAYPEPFRHTRDLRSLVAAAFALCIQSDIRPAECKLSPAVCLPVCARLIANAQKPGQFQ